MKPQKKKEDASYDTHVFFLYRQHMFVLFLGNPVLELQRSLQGVFI